MEMVGLIDYGMGNLLSVFHALEAVGSNVRICREPAEIQKMDRIVLPGVGAFGDCMANLARRGFIDALQEAVIERQRPILGICLGMQAMACRSYEGGEYAGLGWFDADVVRLMPDNPTLRIPQIGWNDVNFRSGNPLSTGIPERPDFYFVHSFYMQCRDSNDVDATCDYGGTVTAAVRKNNIVATQFHPEKSQDYGLRLLENFLKWCP